MLQTTGGGWRRVLPSVLAALLVVLPLTLSLADPDRPNIVLIVVDALRPDHLGCFGYERPTSPNIDEIAAGGIVFETAITQASYTRASFPSFLTSLYPFQHGVTHWEAVLPDEVVTLPEVLRAGGYYSVAIAHKLMLGERFKILRGFDRDLSMLPGARGASKFSEAAIEAIEDAPEPFFLMLHLFDTHKPYMVSDRYVDAVRGDSQVKPYRWKPKEYIGIYDLPSEKQLEGEILLYDAYDMPTRASAASWGALRISGSQTAPWLL
jgi:hypothetical protein